MTALIFIDFFYCLLTGLVDLSGRSVMIHLFGRLLLAFVLLVACSAILRLIQGKAVEKLTDTRKTGVFGEHRIIFNKSELIEITEVNITRHSWAGIGEIGEYEKFIKIPINLSANLIIPKRYFTDEKYLRDFIQTANEYKHHAELNYNPSYLTKYEIESANELSG